MNLDYEEKMIAREELLILGVLDKGSPSVLKK